MIHESKEKYSRNARIFFFGHLLHERREIFFLPATRKCFVYVNNKKRERETPKSQCAYICVSLVVSVFLVACLCQKEPCCVYVGLLAPLSKDGQLLRRISTTTTLPANQIISRRNHPHEDNATIQHVPLVDCYYDNGTLAFPPTRCVGVPASQRIRQMIMGFGVLRVEYMMGILTHLRK